MYLENNRYLVKCYLDPITKKFIPIDIPTISQTKSRKRIDWSGPEDALLEELVAFKGSRMWTQIASLLNEAFHKRDNLRNSKQCRERWLNHLDPGLTKGPWTPQEDHVIFETQKKVGSKWSCISRLLVGRTENQVKNRYNSLKQLTNRRIVGRSGVTIKVEWGGENGRGLGEDSGDVGGYIDVSTGGSGQERESQQVEGPCEDFIDLFEI